MVKRISKKLNDSFESHGLYIILNNARGNLLITNSNDKIVASYELSCESNVHEYTSRGLITREEAIDITSSKDLETLKETILSKGLQNA